MGVLPRVLLVDDDAAVRKAVEFRMRGKAELTACYSADQALETLRASQFDAALVDVNLGTDISGIQLISCISEADPDLAAIVFTAHGNYETALGSLGVHSFDFIPKSLRDDLTFWTKIDQAIVRTREQRDRSRSASDAVRLRSTLADVVVNSELEVTNGDIQRGFLSESLYSFSALLGQVELMDLYLKRHRQNSPGLTDVVRLSEETVAELKDYVGKLRDYFAEPERATNSVNEVLIHATRVVEEDSPEPSGYRRIDRRELAPDQFFNGDGRALLRAIVILLRMVLKAASEKAVFVLKPTILFNPLLDLTALKLRRNVRILNTPNFRKDDRTAVAIEISGPAGKMNADKIASLFSSPAAASEASPWSVVAMISKLNGALVVESKPAGIICYRIILKI